MSCNGCPNNVISENGSNFVSEDSRNFVASRFIEWHLNLPLAPCYGGTDNFLRD